MLVSREDAKDTKKKRRFRGDIERFAYPTSRRLRAPRPIRGVFRIRFMPGNLWKSRA
jgi:hypothetical protein